MVDPVRSVDADASAAARSRVEDLLEQLGRVDLQVTVVSPPDETRLAARERALAAAIAAGRRDLFDEAAAAAREGTMQAFARASFSGTWAFTEMSMSVATANDRIAAAAAFEEAAMAAVVEDVADPETVGILRSTSKELGGMTGIPQPGSLAGLRSPIATIVLVIFVLGFFLTAYQFGLLAVAIPVIMIILIILGLMRQRPAG